MIGARVGGGVRRRLVAALPNGPSQQMLAVEGTRAQTLAVRQEPEPIHPRERRGQRGRVDPAARIRFRHPHHAVVPSGRSYSAPAPARGRRPPAGLVLGQHPRTVSTAPGCIEFCSSCACSRIPEYEWTLRL